MTKQKNKERVERERHRRAFQMYYDMGENRTLEELAEQFENGKYSISTLQKWSSWFNWQDKIKELEYKADLEFVEATKELVIKKKIKLLRDIMDLIEVYKKKMLYADKVTAKDLEILVNLMLKLNGDATEITHVTAENKMTEEDKQTIEAFKQSVQSLIAIKATEDEEDEQDTD